MRAAQTCWFSPVLMLQPTDMQERMTSTSPTQQVHTAQSQLISVSCKTQRSVFFQFVLLCSPLNSDLSVGNSHTHTYTWRLERPLLVGSERAKREKLMVYFLESHTQHSQKKVTHSFVALVPSRGQWRI